jgi:hypothetical protein
MAIKDKRLAHLKDAALAARQRFVATGLTGALKNVNKMEGATLSQLAALDAAETASKAADKALTDYKARKLIAA